MKKTLKRFMKNILTLFFLTFLVISCERSLNPLDKENRKLPINEKLKLAIHVDFLNEEYFNQIEINSLTQFYEKRKYKPIWLRKEKINQKGLLFKELIENPIQFGIPNNRYKRINWNNLNFLEKEIILSLRLGQLNNDLTQGLIKKDTLALNSINTDFNFNQKSLLIHSQLNKKQIIHSIIKLGSHNDKYYKFISLLNQYYHRFGADTTSFRIPNFKSDSLNCVLLSKKALLNKGYHYKNDTLSFIATIKKFQSHHSLEQDGKLGKNTLKLLNESHYDILLKMALHLDKIRNSTNKIKPYIFINLPEYSLLFSNDSIDEHRRIVIGKPENQTPELQATMNRITLFPYWNVPQSIKNKEILPEVKKDPSYLEKHNFKLLKDEKIINPYTINWNNYKNHFPFRLRQDYGPKNSLGIIKFEFENKYGVYIHDTPSKSLFSKDIRAFSHGCMRCQNPVELAKIILHFDCINQKCNTIDSAKVDSLLLLENNYSIRLKKNIEIYVEYNTIIMQENNLVELLDIYDRDKKYLDLLKNGNN